LGLTQASIYRDSKSHGFGVRLTLFDPISGADYMANVSREREVQPGLRYEIGFAQRFSCARKKHVKRLRANFIGRF